MNRTHRRFSVSVTDDDRVSEFTRWKRYGGFTFTRQGAWRMAKEAKLRSYRHVRIIEERIYKGAD